jgi:adenosylcobyric acid synthase
VLQALFGTQTPTLETVFEGLADYLDQHMHADVLRSLIA